ncbi:MAG: hypothetical protein ACYDCI_10780 [Candidatus Limnocylindrales bacterium]
MAQGHGERDAFDIYQVCTELREGEDRPVAFQKLDQWGLRDPERDWPTWTDPLPTVVTFPKERRSPDCLREHLRRYDRAIGVTTTATPEGPSERMKALRTEYDQGLLEPTDKGGVWVVRTPEELASAQVLEAHGSFHIRAYFAFCRRDLLCLEVRQYLGDRCDSAPPQDSPRPDPDAQEFARILLSEAEDSGTRDTVEPSETHLGYETKVGQTPQGAKFEGGSDEPAI